MAEIKSTLDLVMEKTRHLRLSAAEKKERDKIDMQNKIKGLINKYQDNTLSYSELKKFWGKLQKQCGPDCIGLLAKEVLQTIDPEKDNHRLMEILQDLCNVPTRAITDAIDGFKENVRIITDRRADVILKELQQNHGISGSAVAVNTQNDAVLKATIQALHEQFKKVCQ